MIAYTSVDTRRWVVSIAATFGLTLSVMAHSHTCATHADTAPFTEPQYLDISFHSGNDRLYTGKQSLFAKVMADNGHLPEYLPISVPSHPLFPLAEIAVIGKWWNLIGELAANPGITWRYKDHFSIYDEGGTKYQIDRAALSRYPDLERRLAAATPSFDRIEIDTYGVHDIKQAYATGSPRVRFIITANDVIVPPEKQAPYMVPMSPPRWQDRLQIGKLKDKDLIKEWSTIKGIRCPLVIFYNLRLPTSTLVSIANDFKRYSEQDKALDTILAGDDKRFKLDPSAKPYNGPGKNLEPLIAPPQFAEIVINGREISLKEKARPGASSNGRTLFVARDYESAKAVDGQGRYFIFKLRDDGDYHILNATGRKVSVAGFDSFSGAWVDDDKKLHLYPFYFRSRQSLIYTTKFFYQYSMIQQAMSLAEFDQFKREDTSPRPCPYRGGLMAPWSRYDFHRVRLITTDAQLRVIFDGDVVVRGASHPTKTGDRVCR